MNNKGFGLQEVLAFIGVFMFALVAVTIYGNAKIKPETEKLEDKKIEETEQIDYSESLDELTPVDIDKPTDEYIKIENKLKEAAKHYSNLNEKEVISLKELQENYLINEIVDPNNNNIICDGYVIYKNNEYSPYIKCDGIYTTKNYDENLK